MRIHLHDNGLQYVQAFTATSATIVIEDNEIQMVDDIERNGYCFTVRLLLFSFPFVCLSPSVGWCWRYVPRYGAGYLEDNATQERFCYLIVRPSECISSSVWRVQRCMDGQPFAQGQSDTQSSKSAKISVRFSRL